MAQKKEGQDNDEKQEMDGGDPPKDPKTGATPVKPPPPFNPQPDLPG